MNDPKTHAGVIDALGGPRAVAEALGVKPTNNVYHWRKPHRRIPAEWWFAIEAMPLAREKGITARRLASMPVNPASAA